MKLKIISIILSLFAIVLCGGAVAKMTDADFDFVIPGMGFLANSSGSSETGVQKTCEHEDYRPYQFLSSDFGSFDSDFWRDWDIGVFDEFTGLQKPDYSHCGMFVAYCPDCENPSEGSFAGWIEHEMDACSCTICGMNTGENHDYADGVCRVCGETSIIDIFTFTVTMDGAVKGGYNEYNAWIDGGVVTGDIKTVKFVRGMTLAEFLASKYKGQIYDRVILGSSGVSTVYDDVLIVGSDFYNWRVTEDGSIECYRYVEELQCARYFVVMSGDTVLEAKHYDFLAMLEEAIQKVIEEGN